MSSRLDSVNAQAITLPCLAKCRSGKPCRRPAIGQEMLRWYQRRFERTGQPIPEIDRCGPHWRAERAAERARQTELAKQTQLEADLAGALSGECMPT